MACVRAFRDLIAIPHDTNLIVSHARNNMQMFLSYTRRYIFILFIYCFLNHIGIHYFTLNLYNLSRLMSLIINVLIVIIDKVKVETMKKILINLHYFVRHTHWPALIESLLGL